MDTDRSDLNERVRRLEAAVERLGNRLDRVEGSRRSDAPGTQAPPAQMSVSAPAHQVSRSAPPSSARTTPSGTRPRPRFRGAILLDAELEVLIGTSWLNRLGIIAIIGAVAYFLKYSFDNQWIGPTGRIMLTWTLGLVLVLAGERYQRRKLPVFAQGLSGGGIAVLYFAVYAAFAIYRVIPMPPTFAMMVLITAAAVVLSLRYNSMAIATLGLLGGFATPLLLSSGGGTGGDRASLGLYGYFLLLDAGAYVLARTKRWWRFGAVALAAGFVVPAIVGVAGRPDPSGALVYFILASVGALALSVTFGSVRLAWAAVAGGFVLSMFGGLLTVSAESPFLFVAYFGVITLAAILVGERHNWRSLVLVTATAGMVMGLYLPGRAALAAPLHVVILSAAALTAVVRRHWQWGELVLLIPAALVISGASVPVTSSQALAAQIAGVGAVFLLFSALPAAVSNQHTESRVLTLLAAAALFAGEFFHLFGPDHRDALAGAAVILAAYHLGLARMLLRRVHELTILALLGLALTFLTITVPLKLQHEAIPLAWAVETAALAWAAARTRNAWAGGAGCVVGLITLFRLVGIDTPAIARAGFIVTAPGLAFASGVAALAVAGRFLSKMKWTPSDEIFLGPVLTAAAAALLLWWGSWEINGAFVRGDLGFAAAGAKQAALSAWFILYAFALIIVGIWRNVALVRWAGMALVTATIVKVFFIDLAEVEVVFRVMILAILGVLLLLASLAYNRHRARLSPPASPEGGA